MKKIKTFLFATTILGTILATSSAYANEVVEVTRTELDKSQKQFEVHVTSKKLPSESAISSVDIAVWSQEKGQDDLHWYKAIKENDSSFKAVIPLSNHGNRVGAYETHVYTHFNNGKEMGKSFPTLNVTMEKPEITIKGNDLFLSYPFDKPQDSQLKVAIWSEEKGQDDLEWYTVDPSRPIKINLSKHKGALLNIHSYLEEEDNLNGISAQTISRIESEEKATNMSEEHDNRTSGLLETKNASEKLMTQFTNLNSQNVTLQISNVSDNYSELKVPVWTKENGQDDIKWYQAKKTGKGSFQLMIPLSNHGFEMGQYQAHIYGIHSKTGEQKNLLDTGGFQITSISGLEKPKVQMEDYKNGKYSVTVNETLLSRKVTHLNVRVRSLNTNEIEKTVTVAANQFGKAKALFNLFDSSDHIKSYQVEAVVTYSDNQKETFDLGNISLENQMQESKGNNISNFTKKQQIITKYISETNTYPHGQCTWGVKEIAKWIPNNLGNATVWAKKAKQYGFKVGTEPKVGAIAVWPKDAGGLGHVAVVTHVSSNTKIQVKESNYDGKKYIGNFRKWFNPYLHYWGGEVYYIYNN